MTVLIREVNSGPSTAFELEGDYLSRSVTGNYSTVRMYLTCYNGPSGTSGSNFAGSGVQAGRVDGVEFGRRSGDPFLTSGYAPNQRRWRQGPYDVRVYHNSDGAAPKPLSGGRRGVEVQMHLVYGSIAESFSADIVLASIARATQGEIRIGGSKVTSFDVGQAVTVYLPRASSSFTHTLELWDGVGASSPVQTITTGAGVSYGWTPPLSLASMFPNGTSKKFFLRTRTYNGSTQIGADDYVFTLKAPSSMVPTISAINVADDNPAVASAIGGFVQGQSILRPTVVAAGAYGSTVQSSMVTVDGVTAPSDGQLPLQQSGNRVVAAAVTDSRGRTGTASGSVTVLAYDLPDVEFTVDRATSAGVVDPNGVYLKVNIVASVASLVVGTEKNALTLRVATRPRGTTVWTERNVITPGLGYNASVLITGGGIYGASTAWDVRVHAADKLQESIDFFTVSTAGAIVDATATQQAFGKMVETSGPTTQIQGPARVYGALDVDGRRVLDVDDIPDDTGWLTTGLFLSPSSDCTVSNYSLRKIGNRVQGVINVTWAGGTVTPDSVGNFGDRNAIITMPLGWQYSGGLDLFIMITASGIATYGGRVRRPADGAGAVDLTHGMTSRALSNGQGLYIVLDYLTD